VSSRHGHRGHAHRGPHGNPEDLTAYLARLESPERAAWQKPDRVVRALAPRPGQTACELGAGPGCFAFRLARAVGSRGRVFAVDAEPRMLEVLASRIRERKAANITPILGLDADPLLPPGSCRRACQPQP
jgi:cyclopropane fatty-acyl-phospholipid synthase-like methyltransferase